jgi:multidrug resistance efflux pump
MTDFNKQNVAEGAPVLSPSPLESESSADLHTLPLESLKAVLDMTALALEPERFTGSTSAVVTALASRLACDRVSLGIATRNQLRVQALSHSAQFNHKTDLLNAITASMEEAVDQQQTVLVPAPAGWPAQSTRAHDELRRRYGAASVCSLPLWAHGRIVGVLTCERGGEQPFDRFTVELCEAMAALVGPTLDLKRQHDRALPFKIWESVRRQIGHGDRAGHMGVKLSLLLIAALGAWFLTSAGEFRVTSKAVLEGEVQRVAAAPFQGYIRTAPARAGDVVKAGQVLATLQDRDLQLERLKRLNEREQLAKEQRQALAERNAPKAEILSAQLRQVQAQLDLAADKLSRTQIVAPFAGVVVSGDLSQQLDAPVEEGKVLFEVAPLDTYRIVLQVDERDIGHVAVGQSGELRLSALPQESAPVRGREDHAGIDRAGGKKFLSCRRPFLTNLRNSGPPWKASARSPSTGGSWPGSGHMTRWNGCG